MQGPGVVGIIERQARVDFFFGGRSIPGKNEIIVVDVFLLDLSGNDLADEFFGTCSSCMHSE